MHTDFGDLRRMYLLVATNILSCLLMIVLGSYDVFEHFKSFKAAIEIETSLKVKCLRLDGGGEYLSNEFSNFLRSHGIKRQFTCRYTPQ